MEKTPVGFDDDPARVQRAHNSTWSSYLDLAGKIAHKRPHDAVYYPAFGFHDHYQDYLVIAKFQYIIGHYLMESGLPKLYHCLTSK